MEVPSTSSTASMDSERGRLQVSPKLQIKSKVTAADDDYLRFWLMLAVHTFLCPTTSLSISSRCYPALVDLSKITSLNWCQFVVDSLKKSVLKMQKRNSVQGCLLYIVVSKTRLTFFFQFNSFFPLFISILI